MATCWAWSQVIITFVLSQETRHSFPFSRRVMPWSSLRSVVRHCFTLAFIRQYDVILKFNVVRTGGLLCPSLWSTSHRRWGCCSVTICNATSFELTVAPVRFAPDCAPVLLFDCLGHPTFHFTIWYCRCKMSLIKLLCDELLISLLLQ